ncbi:RecA-superfamily ATPase possibly involved in signal transduction [Methanococcoides methylutens]|uniref:RecA-superfamily ATPase possibly involved in signal transduction n=1 Tax=Methanococcoides methylutens TaxID=2226 RepID=A0A099T3Z5_METMT|nr:RAD55 family ATPase [Methanococcoides methylutens]KGK98946.1 RecA-superfamily ATPase possibly involved in signal transduction [Methanococcoides methylutens]
MDYSFDGRGGYRVPTGLLGLDVQLGGGVPPGTTILILAEPGASSELFAQQFVYGGLTNNEEVYYFSAEHPVQEIIEDMRTFGWDVEQYVEDGKMDFVDAYNLRFCNILPKSITCNLSAKDFLKQNTDTMNQLKSATSKERQGQYRGVIDSISYFLRSYDMKSVTEAIEFISSIGKLTNAVQLILMTGGTHDPQVENGLKSICDGVIEFRMKERGSEIERTILIRKMRGMIPPDKTISYNITQKGIELETTTRVL